MADIKAFIKSNLRLIIQSAAFIYILTIGVRFALFVAGLDARDMSVSKPGGVEGFLPISALLGFKQLVMTGGYDRVHAAGLTIFLAILVMSLVFKKSFCGYICPVGLVSESISRLGWRLRIPPYIPVWILKYALLALFIRTVFFQMDLASVQAFINSPYNAISDYKMLQLFAPPSPTTVLVIAGLILLTLIFRNFWCKYLCPYGALIGLVSVLSPVKVRRKAELCINCKKCRCVCPAALAVDRKKTVHNPDCIGCHECIKSCPAENCLNTTGIRYRSWLPMACIGLFLLLIGIGMLSGHWESVISNEQYARFMKMMVSHP